MAKVKALNSDITLVVVLAALIALYVLVNTAVLNIREARLGPLCAKHGWQIIDNNMGSPAKCLDPRTGLMYLPPEVFDQR